MILFEDDWNNYPTAIVDYKTKNQDFVRMSALYREMGVKNHLFPLALINPDLQGVDPFNPHLTTEEIVAIAVECKQNFWYFIREIARDPGGSNDFPIMFRPNRGVLSAYWLYFNHITFFLIMIRQTGKSFGIDWLYIYLLNVATTKYEIAQLTKDEKLRGRELERLKEMELTLPPYMKQRADRDPGNTETMRISSLGNYFKSYLPNKSPKIADMVGRGMTASTAGVDELAYIFNNFITIPVMLSATQAAREVSRMKNEPYGTIFTTTTGKRDTPEGRYAYRLVHDGATWTERFLDLKNGDELREAILNASPGKNIHVNCTFNHRQLGKTDDWLRDRLKDSIQEDQTQVEADYLNLWPSGSKASPFSKEAAEEIRNSEVTDYFTQIDGQDLYALRWYYREDEIDRQMASCHHTLNIDSSDAVGRDALGITLLNAVTGEIGMAATIPKTNLIRFCKWLCDYLEKYLNVTLIIERRATGGMILDYLLLYLPARGIDPFKRIYNTIVQDADDYPDRFREIQNPHNSREDIYTKYKKFFGWATSGSGATSRTDLYSKTLSMAVRLGSSLVRDKILILQILGLTIRNGRVDHQDDDHDDMVISWLLGWWLITLGKNLHHYGIDSRSILTHNPSMVKQRAVKSSYDEYIQQKARKDVELLKEQLSNTSDEYMARRLELDLERAIGLLSDEDRQIISADDLINQLREKREKAMRPGVSQNYLSQAFNSFTNPQSYSNYGYSQESVSMNSYDYL